MYRYSRICPEACNVETYLVVIFHTERASFTLRKLLALFTFLEAEPGHSTKLAFKDTKTDGPFGPIRGQIQPGCPLSEVPRASSRSL